MSDDGDLLIQATTAVSTTATTVTNTTYQQIVVLLGRAPQRRQRHEADLAAWSTSSRPESRNGADHLRDLDGGTDDLRAAALMTEHPDWSTERINMVNTTKSPLPSLNVRASGSGVLQIDKAIDSKVIATTIPEGTRLRSDTTSARRTRDADPRLEHRQLAGHRQPQRNRRLLRRNIAFQRAR